VPALDPARTALGGLDRPPPAEPLDQKLADALDRLRGLHAQQRAVELRRLQARVRLRHFGGIVDELSASGSTALHGPKEARLLQFAADQVAEQVVLVHRLDQRLARLRPELLAATGRVALARTPT
jgi:hypothetical protein